MSFFFTSDDHMGHRNIIKYCNRPFAPEHEYFGEISMESVLKMNEVLIENWNNTVKPEDTIYVLGDFSLGKNWVTEIVPRLRGKLHLIAGNHDWVHPIHYKKEEKGQKMRKLYYDAGFKTIALEGSIEIGGETVMMHHMPYAGGGDHTEEGERYTKWRLEDHGKTLLCGHVHTSWLTKKTSKGTLQLNVGVDVHNYRPISIEEVEQIIKDNKQ